MRRRVAGALRLGRVGGLELARVSGGLAAGLSHGDDLALEVEREVAVGLDDLHELPALLAELVDLGLGAHLEPDAKHVVLEAAGRVLVALPALLLEARSGVAVVRRAGEQWHRRQLIACRGGLLLGRARTALTPST